MKTALALGTFDGIHAGHRAVIEKTLPYHSIAVTFDLPPKAVITGNPQLLMLPSDKTARIKRLGINQVDMLQFCDVKNMSAKEFLETLNKKYKPSLISVGFNYRFGKDAEGDVNTLAEFCNKSGIKLSVADEQKAFGETVSSTFIRRLITAGEITHANNLMDGSFSFDAPIISGDSRGRTLGFPTANQQYPELLVKARFGVYESRVLLNGNIYRAITNIGIRPTFETENIGCETFIKDFSDDIYGSNMRLELVRFIRDEKKFGSSEELATAVKNDISAVFKE